MIKKKYWKEFDKLDIDRNLVNEQLCGIWFKNIGCMFCVTEEQIKKLAILNTEIQTKK